MTPVTAGIYYWQRLPLATKSKGALKQVIPYIREWLIRLGFDFNGRNAAPSHLKSNCLLLHRPLFAALTEATFNTMNVAQS